jgi:tetratricopeptide (TPR) repeat protein
MSNNITSVFSRNWDAVKRIVHRRRTRAILFACTYLMLLTMIPYAADGSAENPAAKLQRMEEEKQDVLRQLRSVEQRYSGDREIRMGLVFLYQKCPVGEEPLKESERQLEGVLALDPAYKIAWATLAMDTATLTIARGRDLVEGLEGMIDNAKVRRATEIYVGMSPPMNLVKPDAPRGYTRRGPLYEILHATFGGKGDKAIVIQEKDYDQARGQVRARFNGELNEALNIVERAETHDSQNALYSYLKAHLHMELDQPGLALRDLQAAVSKPFLQTYLEERQNAVAKALEAADAPAVLKSCIEPFSPIGDYMQVLIWKQHLKPLAIKSEKEGNYGQAREIYRLSVGMAKHIREESSLSVSDYNKGVSEGIERWAHERLSALEKPVGKPSKLPDSMPQKE